MPKEGTDSFNQLCGTKFPKSWPKY